MMMVLVISCLVLSKSYHKGASGSFYIYRVTTYAEELAAYILLLDQHLSLILGHRQSRKYICSVG